MIQSDQNNLYAFSDKDDQKYSKYCIKDNYELVYETTNDQLVINDDCVSNFDGTEISDTIFTMQGNRVQIFDTIFKKKIAEYSVQGTVKGICMTADQNKLAIYTDEEKLYVVDFLDSIDVNQEQDEMTLESIENVKKIQDVLDMKIYNFDRTILKKVCSSVIFTGTSQGEINMYLPDNL